MLENKLYASRLSKADMNRLNKNKDMALDELIALYALPYPNQVIITESQTWIVPKGIKQIKVSGCAAGGAPQAGEYKLDQVIRVREGEVIDIIVGNGNTIFGGYFELAKGVCNENIINSRLGYITGIGGKPCGKPSNTDARAGSAGYGGVFGYGGGAGGAFNTRGGDGVGNDFGVNVAGDCAKGGDASGNLISLGGEPSPGYGSKDYGGAGGGGTRFGSGAGGNSRAYGNAGGGSGGGAGGYGAGGGTGGFNGGYGYYGNAGEGSPGIIIIEY